MMNLERTVLECLDLVEPYGLPAVTLLGNVNLRLAEPATGSEVEAALQRLWEKRQVVSVRHEDRGTIWSINANGQARLRK